MIRTVITLLSHDLAVAFKSKTLYLIVCIPLFVYATLTLVDLDAVAVLPAAAAVAFLRRLPLPSLLLRASGGDEAGAGEEEVKEEREEEEAGSLAARRNAALLRHQTSVPSQVAASVEERGAA